MDIFWVERCGTVVDSDAYAWMASTHKAEPTAKQVKKGTEEVMSGSRR